MGKGRKKRGKGPEEERKGKGRKGTERKGKEERRGNPRNLFETCLKLKSLLWDKFILLRGEGWPINQELRLCSLMSYVQA